VRLKKRKPGVDKLRFHDLRHTAGTRIAKHNDIKFTAQFLGHRDIRTATGYVHGSPEDLKAGAEVLVSNRTGVPSQVPTPQKKAVKTQRAHSSVG